MTEIACPICGVGAEDITAPAFSGKTIRCSCCGDYDLSGAVAETGALERLDQGSKLTALEGAKRSAAGGRRPMILSYNV